MFAQGSITITEDQVVVCASVVVQEHLEPGSSECGKVRVLPVFPLVGSAVGLLVGPPNFVAVGCRAYLVCAHDAFRSRPDGITRTELEIK